ncbi:MAG: hypothetical protein Q8R60_05050 [Mycobacteriales bacterium]|nr:hypothetical protein [Mycobacteriales bacterium]
MTLLTRLRSDDSGVSLAEVLVAMTLALVVGTMVQVGFLNASQLFRITEAETDGQTDVKTTVQRLGRDIRAARSLDAGASPSQLVVWVDTNSDYKKQNSEIVTWNLQASPSVAGQFDVTRTDGAGSRRQSRLIVSNLAFCYRVTAASGCLATPLTQAQAESVRVVSSNIVYDAVVSQGTDPRTAQFSERMRNVI